MASISFMENLMTKKQLYDKKYYKTHKKQFMKYGKIYRKTHKEELKKHHKEYRQTHKIERKEYDIKFKKSHNTYYSYYGKEYRPEHREQRRTYINNRRKTNINFKLVGNLRKRICKALRGISKSKTTLKLLGCSIGQLKNHLEKHFKRGMNWKNYGNGKDKWNIDHIIPKSLFKYEAPENNEFKQCWALANLQPMWMSENCSKKDRIQSVETLHEAPKLGEEKVRHSQ